MRPIQNSKRIGVRRQSFSRQRAQENHMFGSAWASVPHNNCPVPVLLARGAQDLIFVHKITVLHVFASACAESRAPACGHWNAACRKHKQPPTCGSQRQTAAVWSNAIVFAPHKSSGTSAFHETDRFSSLRESLNPSSVRGGCIRVSDRIIIPVSKC